MNQSPPFRDVNLFEARPAACATRWRGPGPRTRQVAELSAFGAAWGSARSPISAPGQRESRLACEPSTRAASASTSWSSIPPTTP